MVGGVGQAGSPVWVPGLAFCPVKEPRRETSAKKAFSKAEIAFGKAEKRPETI